VTELAGRPVLVVGAGIMGSGIAQVATQAGHPVFLYDTRPGAAQGAVRTIGAALEALAAKGRIAPEAARAAVARLRAIDRLEDAADCALAVEAIVEDLAAKRALYREVEQAVGQGCLIASNTSSLSITALGQGLRNPGRFVGMHFFNPVPLMKLVEVVSGLETDPAVAAAIEALARAWGKVPVQARSTPGFIVNRIARPFYAEALMLLQERAAEPAQIDACLRGAGFRMGPCELMDLIGHDTNFAVTQSMHAASFGDRRYVPSAVQRELVEAGRLGRKTGRGLYEYRDGLPVRTDRPSFVPAGPLPECPVSVHGRGPVADRLADALRHAGRQVVRVRESGWVGVGVESAELRLTDGRPATCVAGETGQRDLAVFDLPIADGAGALAWSCADTASGSWRTDAPAWLALLGFEPIEIEDTAGLVVARTVAMLINEAADAVQQGVCTAEAADLAMKLGVNYPAGPFEWLDRWGAGEVVRVLRNLDALYRGERYRASPYLLRRAWTDGMA